MGHPRSFFCDIIHHAVLLYKEPPRFFGKLKFYGQTPDPAGAVRKKTEKKILFTKNAGFPGKICYITSDADRRLRKNDNPGNVRM